MYAVLSYSSLHSLDQSGQRSIDSCHLHLLHLVTVAHLVQVFLTTTTGDAHRQDLIFLYIYVSFSQLTISYLFVSHRCLFACLSLEELCMDQDNEAPEEELTCQLYSTLRQHLGRFVLWIRSDVCR